MRCCSQRAFATRVAQKWMVFDQLVFGPIRRVYVAGVRESAQVLVPDQHPEVSVVTLKLATSDPLFPGGSVVCQHCTLWAVSRPMP